MAVHMAAWQFLAGLQAKQHIVQIGYCRSPCAASHLMPEEVDAGWGGNGRKLAFWPYLVSLQAMQQDIQVKGGQVVTHDSVRVQSPQACQQACQQRPLARLLRQHGRSSLAPIGPLHLPIKSCPARP